MSALPFTHPSDSGLYDLVSSLPGTGLTVIEIGSLTGGSAEVFLKSGKVSKIFCVDPWTNGFDPADPTSSYVAGCEAVFDQRMLAYPGLFEKVRLPSIEAFNRFFVPLVKMGFRADVVYIDGNHQYSAVREDILHYHHLLAAGGTLAGHDYDKDTIHDHIKGVYKAVNELVCVDATFRDTSWTVYNWDSSKILGSF